MITYTARANLPAPARYYLPIIMQTKSHCIMAQVNIPQDTIKQAMKEALTETFAEQSDLLCEVVAEALEDFALAEAIEEGQQTGKVSRGRIFDTLEGGRA